VALISSSYSLNQHLSSLSLLSIALPSSAQERSSNHQSCSTPPPALTASTEFLYCILYSLYSVYTLNSDYRIYGE